MKDIYNIIISGTGGQGVFTLSNVIRDLCARNGFVCQGATFKGGAQRLGSVHTELRIVFEKNSDKTFSSQIPKGELHLLIGLEPWETLRFSGYCNNQTLVVCNSQEEPLYVQRFRSEKLPDPVKALKKTFPSSQVRNYTSASITTYGNAKMVNFLMLKHLIDHNILPFKKQVEADFLHIIDK